MMTFQMVTVLKTSLTFEVVLISQCYSSGTTNRNVPVKLGSSCCVEILEVLVTFSGLERQGHS